MNKVRYLTHEEEEKLLQAAEEPLRTIILVGIYAGLRIQAEALTLRWESVDLKRRLLTVEAAYAKNKETETLPMNSKLAEALKKLEGQCRGEYVFAKKNGQPYRSIRTACCKRIEIA